MNQIRMVVIPDDSNYRVEYAAINHSDNDKAHQNLCEPFTPKAMEDELTTGIILY